MTIFPSIRRTEINDTPWIEKRQSLRFPCHLPVSIQNSHVNRLATDISLGGMSLDGISPEMRDHCRVFTLHLPQGPVKIVGQVVYEDVKKNSGVVFQTISEEKERQLRKYISADHRFTAPSLMGTRSQFPLKNLLLATQSTHYENFSEGTEELIHWLNGIVFGNELVEMTKRYSEIGDRNAFLWQWGYGAIWLTTFEGVSDVTEVCRTKLATLILTTILDDIADRLHNEEILVKLQRHCLYNEPLRTGGSREWTLSLKLASDVWRHIQGKIDQYPNTEPLRKAFFFSYEQLFNSMRYACLSNHVPDLVNLTEYFLYQPPNMEVMIHGMIDLMNHSTFKIEELGKVRKILWMAQELARIANSLVTWERELDECDCSSAVFAYALENGIMTPEEWRLQATEIIREKIQKSDYRIYFFSLWLRRYHELMTELRKSQLRTIDLTGFVASMPRLLVDFHLHLEGKI